MTIDDLIRAHWGQTVVLQGETPEAYAIRRQETALTEAREREFTYLINRLSRRS